MGTKEFSQSARQAVETELERERQRIYAEIHDYPPPIPACDAQFNYLIEKRARVAQEIRQVQAIAATTSGPEQEAAALRQLVETSGILRQKAKTALLKALV